MTLEELHARLADARARRDALPPLHERAAALILTGLPLSVHVLHEEDALALEVAVLEKMIAATGRAEFLANEARFVDAACADADALLAGPAPADHAAMRRVEDVRERVHTAANKMRAAGSAGEKLPTAHAFVAVLNRVDALSALLRKPQAKANA